MKNFSKFLARGLLLVLLPSALAGTPIYFSAVQMTGATNDITINVRTVDNPIVWRGQFFWLPANGTNITTTNGLGYLNLVPGKYTAFIRGLAQSWCLNVPASTNLLSAADLSKGIIYYSGVQSLTSTGTVTVTETAPGIFNIGGTGDASGAASAVWLASSNWVFSGSFNLNLQSSSGLPESGVVNLVSDLAAKQTSGQVIGLIGSYGGGYLGQWSGLSTNVFSVFGSAAYSNAAAFYPASNPSGYQNATQVQSAVSSSGFITGLGVVTNAILPVWTLTQPCGTNTYYVSNAPNATFSGVYVLCSNFTTSYYVDQYLNGTNINFTLYTNSSGASRYLYDYTADPNLGFWVLQTNRNVDPIDDFGASHWAYDNNGSGPPPASAGSWQASGTASFVQLAIYGQRLLTAQGITTNLQFTFSTTRTNTLCFTNGMLMRVTQP